MEIFNAKPRPRVLTLGMGDQAREIESLFPTVRHLDGWSSDFEQVEWDLLVTSAGLPDGLRPHVYVVAFGGQDLGEPENRQGLRYGNSVMSARGQSHASEFYLPDGLASHLRRAVTQVLLPIVTARPWNYFVAERSGDTMGGLPSDYQSLINDSDGRSLAGQFRRKGNEAQLLFLPYGPNVSPALGELLKDWQSADPARFPPPPDWSERQEWQTREERVATAALDSVAARRAEALLAFETEERESRERLVRAQSAAEISSRRILTAQGAELVSAMKAALEAFGFGVTDMDGVFSERDRREDLRVTSPDDADWIAIAEVRGYRGGAAVGDLMRLTRFAKRFLQDERREPSAQWYLVNHYCDDDPSSRPEALATNPNELEAFAEDRGLVVGATTLFRLLRTVEDGRLSAESVRPMFAGRCGRLDWNAT